MEPAFQGFRFIRVENNVINKLRYVTLHELRQNNFRMPWENNPLATPVEMAPESTETMQLMAEVAV